MTSLLLAFLIPFVQPHPSRPRTDPAAWQVLLAEFEARGVVVRSDHPRCGEPDLDGLYQRGSREVVVCERGDRSVTLRHEGWHLVQSLCLQGSPWLPPDAVERGLSALDRDELDRLVRADRRAREAEARLMASLQVDAYRRQVDLACRDRLPRRLAHG